MCFADNPDHDRALLDCFLCIFHLKYPSLWRAATKSEIVRARLDFWVHKPYKVTESLS